MFQTKQEIIVTKYTNEVYMRNKGLKFFFIFATAIFADCVSAATIDNPFEPNPEQPLLTPVESALASINASRALRQQQQDLNRAYTELSKTKKLPEPKKICSYNPYECSLSYYDVAQALLKEIACYLPQTKEQAEGFINNNPFLSKFYSSKESKEIAADSVLEQSLEFQKKYPSNCFGD